MGKGNVCVIYDPDERYAKRLMGIINDDKDIPYKARMFTRKEEFNKYIAGNDTDVLMVNEECYTYEIQKKSNNNVIVLCEEENEARRINDRKKEGHTGVCKYQPAYQLLGTISKKHTETEQNEKEKSFKCIGVYGFNSSLRVMLALVISAAFSRKGKTLFINLDEFSGIEHIMGSDESRNLSDALYMFKQAGIRDSVDNDNSIIENIVGNMQAVQDICMKISEHDVEKQEYITKIEKIYEDIESEINGFSIKTIVQEYEQYTFRADDYNTSITSLNKIYQILKEGAAGLVIDGEISDKSMDYSDLADTCVSGSYGGDGISNIDIRQALVSEYIISRYAGYTDYIEKNGQQTGYIEKKDRDVGRLLDYEIEYILCGRQSDKDNLNEVLFKLVLIREGLNLSYLVTDVQKKNECFGLALQLLGYTGNMVLIKAAQYFIMSIWAYAESVMELRELYAGESIATVKNADNWITDINTVISSGAAGLKTSLFSDKNKAGKETGSTPGYNSLDYMDYMRILLLIKDRTARNAGIMSAMELVMIALGHEDFRMKEYIYEASGTAVFIYVKNGQTYSQKLEYSYI